MSDIAFSEGAASAARSAERPLRVTVLGLRGFPGIQGGIETHAEHLYPALARMGCEVEVIVRSPYWQESAPRWPGIRFRRLWSPRSAGVEALVHSLLGVLYAAVRRPDILHIHAIGPSIVTPLARLLGLRVVVTHHGADYEREKWGRLARLVLRTGEALGMRFANGRIVITATIRDAIRRKYGVDAAVIANGVRIPQRPATTEALTRFGLAPGRFLLSVSRMVPEKRHLDIIDAFERAAPRGWKLALVGGIEPEDDYIRSVRRRAAANPDIVLTGLQTGVPLGELFANAGLFVLASSHEGLPIALLEAISFGLPVLASNIPANREVGLPEERYFPLADVAALTERITGLTAPDSSACVTDGWWELLRQRYDWNRIAAQTLGVYYGLLGREEKLPREPVTEA